MTSTAPLPARVQPMTPLLALCEQRLRAAVSGHADEVGVPAADTLAAGGKRIRPLLVFCSAPGPALVDPAVREHLLSAAAAVELVHMATLVHDDLLDGATMRRGRPTVAQSLGAERAVSTGDFLFARAFGELTRTRSPSSVSALAEAALHLSQGEMAQQRAAFDLSLTEDAYLSRCRRKTAALFSVACRLGAPVGGAGGPATERLAAFGENVGMALVLKTADDATLRGLNAWMGEHLAQHQFPERWYLVEEIPRTSRGKINRDVVSETCQKLRPLDKKRLLGPDRGPTQ